MHAGYQCVLNTRTMPSCGCGQVHEAVEVIAADLLGPLLPRLRQNVDLLVGTQLPGLPRDLSYDV